MSEEDSIKLLSKRNLIKLKEMNENIVNSKDNQKVNYRRIKKYTSLKWERGCLNQDQIKSYSYYE